MSVKIFSVPGGNLFGIFGAHTEDGKGQMRGGKYFFSGEAGDWFSSEWLMVQDNPYACFYTDIPREKRILFLTEPPEIRDYSKYMQYLEQFGVIISMYNIPGYSGRVILSNPHIGWTTGIFGEMKTIGKALNYPVPDKNRTISIVSSLKHKTQQQRKRVAFMREMEREFAGVVDCYGREFNPVDDKLKAIAPYKYHVVIENSKHKYYWTEKLADAWACWSLPIYCGDPSILEQVPDRKGIEIIDVDDFAGSVRKIHEIIDGDIYSSRIDAIRTCREWVMKACNRYDIVCDIVDNADINTPKLKTPEIIRIMLSSRKNFVYKLLQGISPDYADKLFDAYCRKKGLFWEKQ